jgi:hypothetical protein
VKTTEEQMADEWQKPVIPVPGTDGRFMSKSDSLLRNFNCGGLVFHFEDSGTEISTWEEFFDWKSASSFMKDVPVFSKDVWYEILPVFQHELYLGVYNTLVIEELSDQKLLFRFNKENGASLRLLLDYVGTHTLPLNREIRLEQLLYLTNEWSDEAGIRVLFFKLILNGEYYLLKVRQATAY